jgi:uncharacterized membrane protein
MHPRLKIVTTTLLVLGIVFLIGLLVIQARFQPVTLVLLVLCAVALYVVRRL